MEIEKICCFIIFFNWLSFHFLKKINKWKKTKKKSSKVLILVQLANLR